MAHNIPAGSMSKYRAEFRIYAEVEFEDDGEHDLQDLAFEAMEGVLPTDLGLELELIAGSVQPARAEGGAA